MDYQRVLRNVGALWPVAIVLLVVTLSFVYGRWKRHDGWQGGQDRGRQGGWDGSRNTGYEDECGGGDVSGGVLSPAALTLDGILGAESGCDQPLGGYYPTPAVYYGGGDDY